MKRACATIRDLLDRRWDGEALSREDEHMVEVHLGECASCGSMATAMDELLGAASSLRDVAYTRDVVLAPLVVEPRRRAATPLRWAAVVAGAAMAVALGIVIGGYLQPAMPAMDRGVVVRFAIPAPQAATVEVVGDFTNWQTKVPLQVSRDGIWVGEIELAPGRHQYVVVIDGKHMQPDPTAREVVDDGFGGKNSVIDVGI